MIDEGQWRVFGQDTGVTPLLFTRSAMGFIMTTESQELGLTSHPKDGVSCFNVSCFKNDAYASSAFVDVFSGLVYKANTGFIPVFCIF